MTRELKHKDTLEKLCDDLSTDIDGELCDEVKEHLEECPECRVYVDTLKQTVYLYRGDYEQDNGIPDDVSDRLFKVLNLDDIRERAKQES